MATPSSALSSAPVPEQSQLSRVLNVFIAPTKAFTGLDRKASWIAAFLIIAVTSLVFVAAVSYKVSFETLVDNQMKMNPKAMERLEKAPPEQREKQLQIQIAITKYATWASPVIMLAFVAIIAGVLLGTFNFGFGASLRFGTCFSIVMYSFLPSVLKSLLTVMALLAGMDPEGFNIRNPVATNPGALVDATASPALYALLSAIDIFQIWVLILAGIGFAAVSKMKRSTTMGVVFGWFAVTTLIGVAIAAIF